eukprot:1661057-Karenia_brevis.AAC.1
MVQSCLDEVPGYETVVDDVEYALVGKPDDHVRVATVNVNTLAPAEIEKAVQENGLLVAPRLSQLERVFNKSHFDIVGVQESRVKGDNQYNG